MRQQLVHDNRVIRQYLYTDSKWERGMLHQAVRVSVYQNTQHLQALQHVESLNCVALAVGSLLTTSQVQCHCTTFDALRGCLKMNARGRSCTQSMTWPHSH